jgi:hypothetical protein
MTDAAQFLSDNDSIWQGIEDELFFCENNVEIDSMFNGDLLEIEKMNLKRDAEELDNVL